MTKLNPYLTFPGTAAQAIELYKEVFKTEPETVSRYKDVPPQEGMEASPTGGERIMHAAFKVGADMLMLSDSPEGNDASVVLGSQTQISIHPESKEEADRMFAALAEGGEAVMPLAIQFWGDYFGMCRDKFGIAWMINYHPEE